jgi:WD40 repeat protein
MAVVCRTDNQCKLLIGNLLSGDLLIQSPLQGNVAIYSITFSSDGNNIAFAITDGPILIYDIAQGNTRTIAAIHDEVRSSAFSPNGKQLVVASRKRNSAQILDVASGKVLARVPGQRLVAFSPDGRLLATISADVREFFPVELWNVEAGKSERQLIGHKLEIESIAFSADGALFATGSADGTARLWNVEDGTERFVLRAHHGGVSKVQFLLDDKSLATASADGTVKIWDIATGRHVLNLDVDSGRVTDMAVSADGRMIATASVSSDFEPRIDLWTAPEEERQNGSGVVE